MRSEEFSRIRRRLTTEYHSLSEEGQARSAFQPATPWSTVFAQALPSASHHSKTFWDDECKEKCTTLLNGVSSFTQVMDDGTHTSQLATRHASQYPGPRQRRMGTTQSRWVKGNSVYAPPAPASKQQGGKSNASGAYSKDFEGYYACGGKGVDVCCKYNAGECPGICPNNRKHV